jgi:aryl-alcohol dehydrogenase-like predicted oxidoreductase
MMKTIVLHQLGRAVSRLGIGSARFHPASAPDARRLLDAFHAAGGNLVDTAEAYAAGASERVIGEYLQERRSRSDWIILTKVCGDVHLVRPEYVKRAVQQSLDRLQTDHVELLALHRDDESVPVGELVEALRELEAAGLIGAYGVSNWRTERVAAAVAYARSRALPAPSFSSPHLGLATPREPTWPGCTHLDADSLGWYADTGVPVFGWSSQCRGFFANGSGPSDVSNPDRVRVYHSPENFEKLSRARELAQKRGVQPTQIALAWTLNQRAATVALIGPNSVEQLQASLAAVDIQLNPAEVGWLALREDLAAL